MTAPAVEVALDAANVLGEGILWCERAQALYWTDIQRATLFRLRPADGVLAQWTLPERLASFALCEDEGWLLLALASRLAFFRLADGALRPLHAVEPGLPTRCNDGACDRQGRFVFGTLHEPAAGSPRQRLGGFWRLDAGLRLERLPLPAVAISNSLAFSPDGATLYFCDSSTRRIHCCDYGDTLGPPRPFADLGEVSGEPDGSCVDAEGCLWNAQWGLGRVVRYGPDGAVRTVVPVPARQPTRPAFGGPALDTLYLTSARDGLDPAQLRGDPLAGALFRWRPGVAGLPEPRFAGRPG
ncbi:gluconolaconase [Frateuria sp. Soil773]|uniref:SMP-30/gluconolactonase/LRE family protein n=1 Tax=Frateuria sp. Soil773 TaxID=1736407 RepID=UPI0006F291F8|nr:SMP-30/gluconolactonase/LRE family protein [Frateuria sp. Soil773]KRE89325.1 gluconolaconase [Frateuria sp. Soil773]